MENSTDSNRVLILCYAGMVCVALGANLEPVYLTTFSEAFGALNEEQLGRIPATLFVGFVFGILASGPLADRLGAKAFTVAGFLVSGVGFGMLASAWSYASLLVASGIVGLGGGVLDMIMSPIVAAVCHDRRAAALNRLHAFYCIGAVGTVALASLALYLNLPWRWVAAGFGVIPIYLAVRFSSVRIPPLIQPDTKRQGLRSLARIPRFYAALVLFALAGATEAAMGQWLPAYAERVLGFSKAVSGILLAGFMVAMTWGRLWASSAKRRMGPHLLIIFAGVACAIFYLLGTVLEHPLTALLFCVLVGLGCSVLWPTSQGITADRFPAGGASLFASISAAGNMGCIAAPWMVGLIAERWDLRTALLTAGTFPLLLALLMTRIRVLDRGQSDSRIRD